MESTRDPKNSSDAIDDELVEETTSFADLGLDPELLKNIADLGWKNPTVIQAAAIPLAIMGRDCLIQARTGSGKTACYLLPIFQSLLSLKKTKKKQLEAGIFALILVPTRELCIQVEQFVTELNGSSLHFTCYSLGSDDSLQVQQARLIRSPNIVVSTPSRILKHLSQKEVSLSALKCVVLDEADLILSFGFEQDVRSLIDFFPQGIQTSLLSATLTPEVDRLKGIALTKPAVLKQQTPQKTDEVPPLREYALYLKDLEEKFLVLYALLKLRVIPGKSIIFVNSISQCYRVKLFLERFFLPAAALNSQLPAKSRQHILSQFNLGMFSSLIVTDEALEDFYVGNDEKKEEEEEKNKDAKKKKKQTSKDNEFGAVRGLDFKQVETVINFDIPATSSNYVHRVGRTSRAGADGTALSLVSKHEMNLFEEIQMDRSEEGFLIKDYPFDIKMVEGLRYRTDDINRQITKKHISRAQVLDVKREIKNSQKLQQLFRQDKEALGILENKHDAPIFSDPPSLSLKIIPEHLVSSKLLPLVQAENQRVQDEDENSKQKKKKKKTTVPSKFLTKRSKLESEEAFARHLDTHTGGENTRIIRSKSKKW